VETALLKSGGRKVLVYMYVTPLGRMVEVDTIVDIVVKTPSAESESVIFVRRKDNREK
jgi:hypothetical protein